MRAKSENESLKLVVGELVRRRQSAVEGLLGQLIIPRDHVDQPYCGTNPRLGCTCLPWKLDQAALSDLLRLLIAADPHEHHDDLETNAIDKLVVAKVGANIQRLMPRG